jgi:hypothetical protein
MNEELIKQSQIALANTIEAFVKTGDFIAEQTPLVIQELLAWHLTWGIFCIVIGLLILATIPKAFKTLTCHIKQINYNWTEHDTMVLFTGVYIVVAGMIGLVNLIGNIKPVIQIMVAPKIWLLEYAAGLI